jgi:hypothetical protein
MAMLAEELPISGKLAGDTGIGEPHGLLLMHYGS